MEKIGILNAGMYVPEKRLTNADLEKMVETNNEWIVSHTGISERRIAADDTFTSDLAVEATRACLKNTTITPDILIGSTSTLERGCPNLASILGGKLGLNPIVTFDVNAACSGMIYGLGIAKSLLETGPYQTALIAASEKMTSYVDYQDRSSCILFGDGASSIVIGKSESAHEILTVDLGSDPSEYNMVKMGGPGKDFYFHQEGTKVFKFAVSKIVEKLQQIQSNIGFTNWDHIHIITHQANYRIIEAAADHAKISPEHFVTNIAHYGNTSSASIGIAFREAWDQNRFQKDDLIIMIAFGGGLSWASAVIKW